MYRLLFLLLIFGCQKEECKQCFYVVETNEAQALLKCAGLTNRYPKMDYVETFEGSKCGSELDDFLDGNKSYSLNSGKCVPINSTRYKICR